MNLRFRGFQVQVRPWTELNIMFGFWFGAKGAEPEPNRTVASLVRLMLTKVSEFQTVD